ncbi:MAG: phospholipid-binding protein [Isosphaera sp.]|nr:phospholipid-binding protein [Isosphaera sp.]
MSTSVATSPEAVAERVAHRTGRRVRNLAVEVKPGGSSVILRGKSGSYHVKQLAQQAALEAAPEALVENAIVVE